MNALEGGRVVADAMVTVRYVLRDAEGNVADEVTAERPLAYVHGHAQIVPGLEAGLEGAVVGERRTLAVGADEAFGERDEEALLEVERADFPAGAEATIGDEMVATSEDGVEVAFVVVDVSDEAILIDRNHPLAGQDVTFEVEVLDVRPATDQELDAAHEELEQRIAHESAIGYGSSPTAAGRDDAHGLVPLRTKPAG